MKKSLLLFSAVIVMCGVSFGQTILISPTGDGGFETGATMAANGWTVVNDVNAWDVGTATFSAGTKSAYISNVSGSSYTYDNTASSISHFYRDITIPAGEPVITFSFKLKGDGDLSTTTYYDKLMVYTAPTSFTPTTAAPASPNTPLTGATLVYAQAADYGAAYTLVTVSLPASMAGTTFRLIFTWHNDNSTGTVPSSVDEISLSSRALITANAAPVSFTSTGVTQTGMTIGWTDNSTNETAFRIYKSTDNVTFTQQGSDIASTSVAATGTVYTQVLTQLIPGTTYYYRIAAAFEAESPYLTGSQITNAAGTKISAATGNWSAAATWSPSGVPTAGDNVTIADGHTVSIDNTTPTCLNLTVGQGATGILKFTSTTASTFTVNGSITVTAGGSFNGGAVTTIQNLYIGGNSAISPYTGSITDNGIFDMYTTSTTGRVTITFFGNQNSVISGTGATLDLYTTTILNKGNTIATPLITPPVLDIQRTFTVNGAATAGLITTHTAGTLKISGTFTLSSRIFVTTAYIIPATGGVWIDNPNYTMTGIGGAVTNNGLFRLSNGTYNIGTTSTHYLIGGEGAVFLIEGGILTTGGKFYTPAATTAITYTQTGGIFNVATGGSSTANLACFQISSASSVFNMSGGTIILCTRNSATLSASSRDYYNIAVPNITGGTLQVGRAATATNFNFRLYGYAPGIVIDNTTNNKSVEVYQTAGQLFIFGPLTVNTGTTFDCKGMTASVSGNVTNNGVILGLVAGSRFDFSGSAAQTYSGTGTFGTAALPFIGSGVGISNTANVTLSSPIYTTRVNLFAGSFINSNQFNLGIGGASSVYIQRGGGTAPAGLFDAAPTFNIGTGGITENYTTATTATTTGFEIPSSRIINSLVINNAPGVTLSGGDLTVGTTAAAGLLTLTTGLLHTGVNSLLLPFTGTSISGGSATAYVDGKLVRSFAASRTAAGTYTAATFYPIGKDDVYMPAYIDPTTNAGGTVSISGEAFTNNSGSGGSGVSALSRHRMEALITNGNANFISTYLNIGDEGIVDGNQILQATSATGTYVAVPSVSTFTAGTPNTLTTTGTPIPAASYNGYFAYGNLTSCSTPAAQPTLLVSSYVTATGFIVSFSAAVPAPSDYLVVRYSSLAVITNPVDHTTYTVGASLGNGTIVSASNATTFTETALTVNTTYYYYIYSFNNSGCYGPIYLTILPLTGSITTCTAATGTPGTPTKSLVTTSSFTASWTASSTAGVRYLIDVATDAAFASFVSGYHNLDLGTGTLSRNVTGLSAATPYYVRVRAVSGSCYSVYSPTLVVSTWCNSTALPYSENFDSYTVPSVGCGVVEDVNDDGVRWKTSINYTHSGTKKLSVGFSDIGVTMDDWYFTQGLNLTAGHSYDLKFYYRAVDGSSLENLEIKYGSLPYADNMISEALFTQANYNISTYTLGSVTFIPATTGTFYIGFHNYSIPDQWGIYVDDITVESTPLPTVTTTVADAITGSTAQSGGNVTVGNAVTSRGVCWSTTANPTIASGHTTNGSGTGSFISSISGLLPNTLYYYRAYATNTNGTSYGSELSFTTLNVFAPAVIMGTVSGIVTSTATAGGTVADDGGSGPVTENGFVYATTVTPLVGGAGVSKISAAAPGIGVYSLGLTGLTPGTLYYINAYAVNSVGIGYGTETSFTTYAPPTITTTAATAVAATTASSGGNVTNDFNSSVTARGVCYGITINPDLNGSFTSDGTGRGIFTSSITGLTSNTVYHVRAYATNAYGTTYGSDLTFQTVCFAVTLPYEETFDGSWTSPVPTSCWRSDVGAVSTSAWHRNEYTTGWEYDTDGSPSAQGALNTAHYARFHSYGIYADETAYMETEDLNLSSFLAADVVKLNFYYINPTGTDQMDVYFSADGGTTWSASIATYTTDASWSKKTITIDMSVYNSARFMIRFGSLSDYGNDDIGLDQVSVTRILTVPVFSVDPASKDFGTQNVTLQSAAQIFIISNTSGGDLIINPAPTLTGAQAGQFILTDANTYPLHILEGASATVSVKFAPTSTGSKTANLTIIDNLPATHNVVLTGTGNPSVTIPYFENFDAAAYPAIPSGWSQYSSAAMQPWITANNPGNTDIIPHSAPNFAGVFYSSTDPKAEWLVSPPMSMTKDVVYGVSFWIQAPGFSIYPERLKLTASTNPSLAGMAAGTVLWNNSNLMDDVWTQYQVSFTPSATGVYYFGWYAYSIADLEYIAMDDISVTTLSPPVVTTSAITDITIESATGGGNISSDGGATITSRGVCWGPSANPTIANSILTDENTGTGAFVSSLIDLNQNTNYNVRAFATNAMGTFYGQNVAFSTLIDYKSLDLSDVLLEGLYDGYGSMRRAMDETGFVYADPDVADRITVELHNAANYNTIAFSDTVDLSTSGMSTVLVPANYYGSYYITIKHRNSLETVSATAVSFAGSYISKSFGTPAKVWGGNLLQMADMGYAIYGGDVNQDGVVDGSDMGYVENDAASASSGYLFDDCNGDGLIDSSDMGIIENNAAMAIGIATP